MRYNEKLDPNHKEFLADNDEFENVLPVPSMIDSSNYFVVSKRTPYYSYENRRYLSNIR